MTVSLGIEVAPVIERARAPQTQPMGLVVPSVSTIQQWRAQDRLHKALIALSLLLVVFAYLPTLTHDYVAPDQWRAFRYSILPQTPFERAKACARTVAPYYSRTGRQLLWISECIEHAAVAKISDFVYLRPFVLAVVLFSAIYIGGVLAPFLGGLAWGVVAASALTVAPAYAVMYLQGMTGATVLISLILAAASFKAFRAWLDLAGGASHRAALRKLIAPLSLFVVSCMIYPSWSFLVIGLSWIAFGADIRASRTTALKRLGATLLFYFVASLVYYVLERSIELILQGATGYAPDMREYAMGMQLSPGTLLERAQETWEWFYRMPPLNFAGPPGLLLVALALFCAYIGWQHHRNHRGGLFSGVLVSLAAVALGCVVLLGSLSPWIFSSMDYMASRFLMPWYLLFCVVAVRVVRVAVDALAPKVQRFAAAFAVLVFLLPVAIRQERLSRLETEISGLEVQSVRAALGRWIDGKGYEKQRYLLFVRPALLRSPLAERIMGTGPIAGENGEFSSAQNPIVIPFMTIALLRERTDHPIGRTMGLKGCVFEQSCIPVTLKDPHTVAIGIADAVHVIRSSEDPYVINLSGLTSRPIVPVIEHIETPRLSPEPAAAGPAAATAAR
jgi:hypothetical protein